MDAGEIYHFLFETYAGIGVLVVSGLVISLILCVVMERKTRKVYKDRGPKTDEDDEWSLFDDDDDAAAPAKKAAPAEETKPEIKKATVRRRVD